MQNNSHCDMHADGATWVDRAHKLSRSLMRAAKRFEDVSSTAHCAALPRIPRQR